MSRNANTRLFVTDLPEGTTESLIREHFEPFGAIQAIHLASRQKAMTAKITYAEREAAERALLECNYRKINGREIHVVWHRQKVQAASNNALQIVGLPPSIDEPALHKKLQEFVLVERCRMSRHESGAKTGRAVVFFETGAAADEALAKLSGEELFGRHITVTKYTASPRAVRAPHAAAEDAVDLPAAVLQLRASAKDEPELRAAIGGLDQIIPLFESSSTVLAVFDDPKTAAGVIVDRTLARFRPSAKSTVQGVQLAVSALESRTVFVAGFQAPPDDIVSLMATAGPIATFEAGDGPASWLRVRFHRLESRARALETLHRAVPPGQTVPISVLPYFDRQPPHAPAGLLELNELPPELSTADLRAHFARYGPVLAAAVTPMAIPGAAPIGFVLFQAPSDAVVAKSACGLPNVLLHPPVDPAEAVFGFMASESARDACVRVFEPASFPDARVCPIPGCGAFAFFTSAAAAVAIFARIPPGRAELLNGNALAAVSARLTAGPLPIDWSYALLYVRGLAPEIGPRALREGLERLGIRVEAAFVNLVADIGTSRETGIVFVGSQRQGAYLIEQGQGQYSVFNSRGGYILPPIAQQRYQMPPLQQGKRRLSAREWMKQFAVLNFPDCQAEVDAAINELSVNDTWELVGDFARFTRWIEDVVAKIKRT
jgi:hypothetical protein